MTVATPYVSVEDVLYAVLHPLYSPEGWRVVSDLRKVTMPDASTGAPEGVIEQYKVTGFLQAPLIEVCNVDVDVYHLTRLGASDMAARVQTDMLHNIAGTTAAGATIAAVALTSGYAERPYVNDNVYRFGLALVVTVHSHPS